MKEHAPVTCEHNVEHRTLQLMATVDGLNLKALTSAELLLRRIQLCEEAVGENPDNPSYEGASHFMGAPEKKGVTLHRLSASMLRRRWAARRPY